MTERTVSIQQGIQDEIDSSIRVNAHGLDQAWKASAQARAESPAVVKDLFALGELSPFKAVALLDLYQDHGQRPSGKPGDEASLSHICEHLQFRFLSVAQGLISPLQ